MKIIIYWIFCYLKSDHFNYIMFIMRCALWPKRPNEQKEEKVKMRSIFDIILWYTCCVLFTGARQITENIVILTLESQINDGCIATKWMVTMTKMDRKMDNKFDIFIAFHLFFHWWWNYRSDIALGSAISLVCYRCVLWPISNGESIAIISVELSSGVVNWPVKTEGDFFCLR